MQYDESLEDIRQYLEDVTHLPTLSLHAEQQLVAQIALDPVSSTAEAARTQLIEANLRMVVHIARRYDAWGLALADLIQEGNLALVQAARRFDPTRSQHFRAFARCCVHWALLSVITAHLQEHVSLNQQGGEQARDVGVYPLRAQTLKALAGAMLDEDALVVDFPEARVVSLDALGEEESVRDGEGDDRSSAQTYEQALIDSNTLDGQGIADERRAVLLACISSLSYQEQQVLLLRFLSDEPWTLGKIGERLAVTRERVRQLEVCALRKLRHPRCANVLLRVCE